MNNNLSAIEVSSKLAYLQPGLYIVRLTEDAPGNVVMLSSSPVGRGTVDFFPGDGVLRNTLAKLGDCVVLRVKSALASLLITEFHKSGQAHKVALKIDKIGTGHEPQAAGSQVVSSDGANDSQHVAANPAGAIAHASSVIVRKVGHIEGVGDVVSQSGWLGDPTSVARLEGFAISVAGLPQGVQLNYGVLIEGTQRYASAVAGQFIGTRQKAKALLGAIFELTGPNSKQFQISGQVAFAGFPPLAIEPGVPMSGPSGAEQLVALHLSVEPSATQPSAASAWEDPTVTRIARKTSVPVAKKALAEKAPTAPTRKVAAKKATTTRNKS